VGLGDDGAAVVRLHLCDLDHPVGHVFSSICRTAAQGRYLIRNANAVVQEKSERQE
jgi:hypothetical protein